MFIRRFLRTLGDAGRLVFFIRQFVAGLDIFEARIVVFQALQLVMRCFQRFVGNEQHVNALFEFDFGDFGTLFVQQERSHFDRHLAEHGSGAVFERFFLNDAQNLQRAGFGIADMPVTTATGAGNRRAFR